MKTPMLKTKYQEHSIGEIFRYFVDGFQLQPDETILDWKTNYDPHTGKVIFIIFIEGKDKDSES